MRSRATERVLRDSAFPHLKAFVIERTGLTYWADKDVALAERLARLLGAEHGPRDCAALAASLEAEAGSGPLTEAMIAEVTVGETYFFRNREQFAALRDVVIPELLEQRRDVRQLSLWSAGCSNGAEPYSLSILLRELMGVDLSGWSVAITGTDISRAQLRAAARAEYNDWALRDVPAEVRDCCIETAEGGWRLQERFKQGVAFHVHNLIGGGIPPGAPFDLALCRNVLIYFDAERRRRALGLIASSLREGGWLVLGHAEGGAEVMEDFSPVRFPEATLYRKSGPNARPSITRPVAVPALPPTPPALRRRVRSRPAAPAAEPPPAAPEPLRPIVERMADGGEWQEAAPLIERWVAREPLEPLAHYYQGLVSEHIGIGDALSAYRRAVYLDRSFALAHLQLGRLCLEGGDRTNAARHLRNVVSLADRDDDQATVKGGGDLTVTELRMIAERWLSSLTSH